MCYLHVFFATSLVASVRFGAVLRSISENRISAPGFWKRTLIDHQS
ncbi:hypothetical protein ARZXY2_2762 [Arthrobacter sp. ZXY-2]|nr:hypothetical protein ARZXY2_2762 [Arthrobacter sp. ZXY-2]